MGDAEILEAFKHGTSPPDRQVCQGSGDRKRAKKAQTQPSRTQTGSTGGDQTGETHGQHDSEIGCRTTVDEKASLLCLLSANRRTSVTAPIVVEGEGMACTDEAMLTNHERPATICPAPTGTVPGHGHAAGGQGEEALHSHPTRSTVGDGYDTWSSDHGRALSFPAMVSTAENTHPDEEGTNSHEPNVEVHGADETHLPRPRGNPEVSRVETGGHQFDSAMDSSDRHETRRSTSVARDTTGFDGMGPHWGHDESTHPGSQSTEPGTSTTAGQGKGQAEQQSLEIQGQRQAHHNMTEEAARRHQLRARFEVMQLINLENWCYANTALVTLLWALLICLEMPVETWGALSQHIVHFLRFDTIHPIHLPDVAWL